MVLRLRDLALRAAPALGARELLPRLWLVQFARDVERLNTGDHTARRDACPDQILLRFHDGAHGWARESVGPAGTDSFPQDSPRARHPG